MPSPPLARRLLNEAVRRWSRHGTVAAVTLLVLAAGCASRDGRRQPGPAGPISPPELTEAPFLVDPLEGFPREVDDARRAALAQARASLHERRDLAEARARAEHLLAADPAFDPALVLLAQVELEAASWNAAIERLSPVVERYPQYSAARLALARALDRTGAIVEAYAVYRGEADLSAIAATRAGELLPRALEIVSNRIDDALARGELERADEELSRLTAWSPGATAVLEASRRVALAMSNPKRELAAVARLAERFPDRRDYLERRGDLELAVGRASAAVEAYQALLARHADDAALAEKLERAKFRWRLDLLPGTVRTEVEAAELSRGGFSALLYWVVPDVRYARPSAARIATDILEHPQREAIARVVNLGLLPFDATLHRFSPETPVTQAQALSALLTVLSRHSPKAPSCVAGQVVSPANLCTLAERCDLLGERACSTGGARLSGADAVEMLRRALKWL